MEIKVPPESEDFSPEYEQYMRREVGRAIERVGRVEYAEFTAESVIAAK